jgi:prepilin-type N-terminal cleavage/methylation domain-containing protein
VTARERGGFTLVELLVVVVLGSLVLMAALQVLITNQRTYTAQNAQIAGQQSTRMALEVLFAEMREVSPEGGDILMMSQDSIRVRLMRKFSIVCGTVFAATPQVFVINSLSGPFTRFAALDSVFVWSDNEVDTETDDHWIPARVTAAVTTAVCPTDATTPATLLSFAGQAANFNVTTDSVTLGAPVRSYLPFAFGLMTYSGDGQPYLGRRQGSGPWVPVAGPLRPNTGLEFVYRDSLNAVTATPADVRQIVVRVRSGSRQVLNSLGEPVTDSILAWVYTRN